MSKLILLLLLSLPLIYAQERTVIGYSAQGRELVSYRFGQGEKDLILVGGIHGGYEWNTTALSYQLLDYFKRYPQMIPTNISLHIIPTINPDGLFQITKKEGRFDSAQAKKNQAPFLNSSGLKRYTGRFNGNGVDLNRNWGYNWKATALIGSTPIKAGDRPFSEPESRALRDFVLRENTQAVIFYHSAFDKIFGAGAGAPYQASIELGHLYADASGYPVEDYFTAYPVNGDAGDWMALAEIDIPSITVELKNHQDTDYGKNLAGVFALLGWYR